MPAHGVWCHSDEGAPSPGLIWIAERGVMEVLGTVEPSSPEARRNTSKLRFESPLSGNEVETRFRSVSSFVSTLFPLVAVNFRAPPPQTGRDIKYGESTVMLRSSGLCGLVYKSKVLLPEREHRIDAGRTVGWDGCGNGSDSSEDADGDEEDVRCRR